MNDTRPVQPTSATSGRWETLYANEVWYLQQPGEEAQFTGALARVTDIAPGSTMQRQGMYRLGDRTIYTAGQPLPALEARVGRSVVIRGKAVAFALEGQQVREIWPAAVRSLNP